MNNIRTCAKCGKDFLETKDLWPIFPTCSLCEEVPESVRDFCHYLQVAHKLTVTDDQAKEIIDIVKKHF